MSATPTKPPPVHLTVPQLAARWAVSPDKVILLIRSGRLRAWDAATPGSKRPRWRIALADALAYEQSRAARPEPKAARRRKTQPNVIEFF